MTINERLHSMTDEMYILSQLDSNERPYQDVEGNIVDKYDGVKGYISAGVQALQRSYSSTQSTRSALKHIDHIAEEIMQYVMTKPTPFEYYMTYSKRVENYSQLLNYITQTLDSGLPNFLETSITSSASWMSISTQEKQEREALFTTTTEKMKVVAKKLKEKISEYNELNACASEHGLPPPREYLQTIIDMILNPDPKLNISTLNINGYQDFCAEIVKELLTQSFGVEHIAEIFRFYGLEHAIRLTYADLQAIIIGTVSNLTLRDIREILSKKEGIAYKILSKRLPKGIPSELEEENVLYILDILRTIDIGGASCPTDRRYSEQLYGDILFLESCKKFRYYNWKKTSYPDLTNVQLRVFGRVEQFAREYVYGLFRTDGHQFRQGILFPSYDENADQTCFEGHTVFRQGGINAFASIPAPEISNCKNLAIISFRGTYKDEEIPKSATQSESSGLFSSFWQKSEEIPFKNENESMVSNFLSIVGRMSSPVNLKVEVTGQGYGGSAAQRFTEALSYHFTTPADDCRSRKISEINLYCFDSYTTEDPVVNRFIVDCLKLSDLKFKVRYFNSNIKKIPTNGGSHYLGYLDSKSNSTATNLDISVMNFSFIDKKSNPHEQLSEMYPRKSASPLRFYEPPETWGNNDSFFMERNKYELKKGNPSHLNYYCTTSEDHKLIKTGTKISALKLPDVLTVNYSPST